MSSSHSQILNSFDPHAIHPFTNGSGLVPQPPQPSQYPIPIPSPRRPSAFSPTYSQFHDDAPPSPPLSPNFSVFSNSPSSPVIAPRPMSSSPSRSPCQPIFVPFRQDTSSPDLILKKKVPLTRSASTQTPTTIQKAWYPTHTSWLFHIPMWVDWWIIMEMGVLPCVCLALIPFALHAFSF